MGNPHYLSPCFHIRADGWHVRERPAPTSKRFVADGVLTGPGRSFVLDLGLVEQTTFSAGPGWSILYKLLFFARCMIQPV